MKCIFSAQETYMWKYGMADHVTRGHSGNALVGADAESAKKFKEASTISESERAAVLKKFKGRAPRSRAPATLPPPSSVGEGASGTTLGPSCAGHPTLRSGRGGERGGGGGAFRSRELSHLHVLQSVPRTA